MAEVNAFSIDGTKYQLTATDQTYVGETGLAQLGLDYTCTPDELNEALTDAGGGVAILDGSSVEGDGWDLPHANGMVRATSSGDTKYYRGVLEWLGPTSRDGSAMRMTAYDSDNSYSFDGTEWTTLVYGYGDTWSPDGSYIELAGRWNGAGTSAVVTIPLGAPVAPGITSATCTTAGTTYVYNVDGDGKTVTSTSKHSLAITRAGLVDTVGTISSIGSSNTPCVVQLPTSFTVKFS